MTKSVRLRHLNFVEMVTVWRFWSPKFTIFLHYRQAPRFKRYHQHRTLFTNNNKLSTTLSHQNRDIANITITTWDFMHLWLIFQIRIRSSMLKKPLIFFEPLTRINHWSDPTLVKIPIHEVKIMKIHSRWRHSISRLGLGSFVFLNSLSPDCPIMWPINFGPFRKTSNLINNQTCPIIFRGVSI